MNDSGRRPWSSPAGITWSLSAILAALAGLLAVHTNARALLPVPLVAAPWVIAALFAAAEARYISVEFRRQTYSFTLAGIPLVLGLQLCPMWQVLTARVLSTAVVLLFQRLKPVKLAYNLAAFAFETALAGAALHSLDQRGNLSLTDGLAVYAVIAGVDLLMSSLVLLVIRLHGGVVGRREVVEALLPAAAFNAISLTYALLAVQLLEVGPLGWTLLAALSAVSMAGYRAHTRLSVRHQTLQQISEFVEEDVVVRDVEELASHRLATVRTLLRAGSAHVVLPGTEAIDCLVTVDDGGRATVTVQERGAIDWLSARVREQDEAVLLPRNVRDPGLRRWLTDRGARDAIMVPVTYGEGLRGTLTVTDRISDHATFTADDVTMLRTLAGHLGVALRSTRLLQRLRHEATHDVLTGLANRALLQEHLDAALDRTPPPPVAVLLLDLDGFKEVNDALGHDVGDRLLRVVGERLLAAAPEVATVARLGGDEFAVLLPDLAVLHDSLTVEALAHQMATSVAAPIFLDGGTLSIEASIGVATTDEGASPQDLLRHADTAMYAAKAAGLPVQRYTAELDRGRGERLALVADLRLALDRDELFVMYQPKLDLQTRRVAGVEALVRWQHPRLGTLTPAAFILIAESTGLIEPLTAVVLRSALAACRTWRDSGLPALTVAVNLSARTVADPNLPRAVSAALAVASLPPSALVLEITESSVMGDAATTVPILHALVDLGVAISLDDFGTGYSSLAYLQRLPVQEVKIDRSFVSGLVGEHQSSRSEALIRSIVGLGRAFQLKVVAEGVEDAASLERLTDLGCDVAQGYHVGRPMRADQVLNAVELLHATDGVGGRQHLHALTSVGLIKQSRRRGTA